MEIQFWGVRGSSPSPLSAGQIREKIDELVSLASPVDFVSPQSKRKFLENLPESLYGTAGGNTPCVEFTSDRNQKIIFDAGTGIRLLGKSENLPENLHYNLCFSHFHWDHIQGLPFFDALYNPGVFFDVYSPFENMEDFLSGQMKNPYYPVDFGAVAKRFSFHKIEEKQELKIDDMLLSCIKMSHPGGSCSYSVSENGKKFVYATDVELKESDFIKSPERSAVFGNADALVFDSQYTVEESLRKTNWGHSAFCSAIDFAAAWNVKKLFLFHHEPTYDDRKLYKILDSARWYAKYAADGNVEVNLAVEGQKIEI